MTERFKLIPLTIDNILSFEDYMPRMVQQMILRDPVSGWGVIEDDVVSGVAMVELIKDTNPVRVVGQEEIKVRILWLYVDEEVRGQGIGKELMNRCMAFAEENNAIGIYCRYPGDDPGRTDDFLIRSGFSVEVDGREDIVEAFSDSESGPAVPLHTAWLRLKGKAETRDRQIRNSSPDMGRQMPRLNTIALYLEEMGYDDCFIKTDDRRDMVLIVSGNSELPDVSVSVQPDEDDLNESYTIIVRSELPYRENPEAAAGYLERWQKSHLMTVGEIKEETSSIEFTAMIPVESGAVDEERFRDFFTAFCADIDSFE